MFETLYIIAEQVFIHFPLIIGAYISISLMKVPDLSPESAYVFGAMISCVTLPYVYHLPLALLIIVMICVSLFGGMIVGALSSLLTQYAHIPHLLSSIITIGIFHGVSQCIAGPYVSLSTYNNPLHTTLIPLHPELPTLFIIFMLCTVIMRYFFSTELGYCLAVFGDNPRFFKHYGISTRFIFITGIILANAFAGLSGYLVAQANGFADITMGFGKILLCITALIIGKMIQQKTLSIIPAISGLFGYFLLQQLLLKIGFDLRYFTMIQACIILIIMLIHYRKKQITQHEQLGV